MKLRIVFFIIALILLVFVVNHARAEDPLSQDALIPTASVKFFVEPFDYPTQFVGTHFVGRDYLGLYCVRLWINHHPMGPFCSESYSQIDMTIEFYKPDEQQDCPSGTCDQGG